MSFDILTRDSINTIIKTYPEKIVHAVKQAYIAHSMKETINPPSYFLKYPENPNNRIIALPAHIGGEYNVSGIKWISSRPENTKADLPRASAVLILNDYETGFPFACLESGLISATRTALSCVIAANNIRKKNEGTSIGVVGAGYISENILSWFHFFGWEFDSVLVFDKDRNNAKKLREKHGGYKLNVVNSLDEIKSCGIILFATTATSPYYDFPLKNGQLLLNISLRDISSGLIKEAVNIVDDIEHILQANTSVDLAYKEEGHSDFIYGTIGEIITGQKKLNDDRAVIFSPMGLGVLDIAVGCEVYKIAQSDNKLISVDNFFGE
jgi:ornithine cyclodeaminase